MSAEREPIPPGRVSVIRGRWQRPALGWVTRIVLVAAFVAGVLPGAAGRVVAVVICGAVIATPLLRVAWLVLRWNHEGDRRFVVAGAGLLVVVAAGGTLAALGVG